MTKLIKLTRSKTKFLDSVTGEERFVEDPDIVLNPAFIKRIQSSHFGDTVVEIDGEDYPSWCKESPAEIYRMVEGRGDD